MKLTVNMLKSINAHDNSILRFKNTPKLHDIDFGKTTEITTIDENLYNDLFWLAYSLLKGVFFIKKITSKDSDEIYDDFSEYKYDLSVFEIV